MDARRLARLRWHCRRGMRELDVVLGRYLERDYLQAGTDSQRAFESLLEWQDPEILALLRGALDVQDEALNHVVERLLAKD